VRANDRVGDVGAVADKDEDLRCSRSTYFRQLASSSSASKLLGHYDP
jgi:hypothetical protein